MVGEVERRVSAEDASKLGVLGPTRDKCGAVPAKAADLSRSRRLSGTPSSEGGGTFLTPFTGIFEGSSAAGSAAAPPYGSTPTAM